MSHFLPNHERLSGLPPGQATGDSLNAVIEKRDGTVGRQEAVWNPVEYQLQNKPREGF